MLKILSKAPLFVNALITYLFFLAVHRTLIDACRTIVVWLVDLFIHYVFDEVIRLHQIWIPSDFCPIFPRTGLYNMF